MFSVESEMFILWVAVTLTKIKVQKWTKGNNSNIREDRVMVLVQCTSTQWDLFTYRVSCWYLLQFQLCSGQSSKYKNEKRAKTPKLGKAELQFLSTALLLNEINIALKFLVEISCSFRIMSWTRCCRADGHRNKVATIGSPFGEHKR